MKNETPYWIEPIIVNGSINGYSVVMNGGLMGTKAIKTYVHSDVEYALLCAEELVEKLNESI